MGKHILVNNSRKYSGRYVATASFSDTKVLYSGDDPADVLNQAKKSGVDDPVVFYVPREDLTQSY